MDTRLRDLEFKIKTIEGGNSFFEIYFKLTDPTDLKFLLWLRLREEGYSEIKKDFQYKTDFRGFADTIKDLTVKCLQNGGASKYFAKLKQDSRGEHVFHLVEEQDRRDIVHVTLKLTQGNDTEIKDHLAEVLRETLNQLESTTEKYNNTFEELEMTRSELEEVRCILH